MKKSTRFESRRTRLRSRRLVPAIAAIGSACGLAATSASALELGDIQVESKLGQPLRASIAYALGPNEQLYDFCIYLRPGPPSEGIPSVARARISLSESTIVLSGNVTVKEPLLNVRVAVDCPYLPHIQREYTLMVNPGEAATAPSQPVYIETQQVTPVSRSEPIAAEVMADEPARTPLRRTDRDDSPIAVGGTYRVQTGDTASGIASRIANRGVDLASAALGLVDANRDAFVDGDVNRLMAGSLLVIPDFNAKPLTGTVVESTVTETIEAPAETVPVSEPTPATDTTQTPLESVKVPVVEALPDPIESVPDVAPNPVEPVAEDSSPVSGAEPPAEVATGLGLTITASEELRPGDVIVPPANSDILPIEEAEIPSAAETTEPAASGAWSWLIWLLGAGVAIILGVLTIGDKFRGRFSAVGAAIARKPARESDEKPTHDARAAEDLDYSFDDLTPAREMALDADFGDGTGLSDSVEIDVLQDFGFAAEAQSTDKLDLEITEDLAREPAADPTDIIPPSHRIDESSILDVEFPPGELRDEITGEHTIEHTGELTGEHTGGYDMSMIVDATKQAIGNYDRTAQDLQAVRVDDEEYMVEDQTLSDEVGLKVLEQDYEDELSATQALNLEIERAARELAERMDGDGLAETLEQPIVEMIEPETAAEDLLNDGTSEDTASNETGTIEIRDMPPAPDGDLTAELKAKRSIDMDVEATVGDETGTIEILDMSPAADSKPTAKLTAKLPTDIEAENDPTASDTAYLEKLDMAAAGSDVTFEIQVETGKFDTKKIKKKKNRRK